MENPAGRRLRAEPIAEPAAAQYALDFAFLASLGLPLLLAGCRSDYRLQLGKKRTTTGFSFRICNY